MICSAPFGIALLMLCSASLAVTGFHIRSGTQYWAKMCAGIEEVTDNSTCKDGVYKNPCGKFACLVGVAGKCDDQGSPFRYGKCADSLWCKCAQCEGCLNGECYTNVLCFSKSSFTKRINNFPIEYSTNNNEYE